MGRLCGGAHEISGSKAPLFLCGGVGWWSGWWGGEWWVEGGGGGGGVGGGMQGGGGGGLGVGGGLGGIWGTWHAGEACCGWWREDGWWHG